MSDYIAILVLYLIISFLFAIEASTSLARIAGLSNGNLASGLQVQSGLSIFSRALMAIFMPLLGSLSDLGKLKVENKIFSFYCTILIPIFIYIVYYFRVIILKIYIKMTLNLLERGTYFPVGISKDKKFIIPKRSFIIKKLLYFRFINLISYAPYYCAWTVIIFFLSIYPNYRGFIIGLSSVMNGINTIALVFYVDPYLIKMSHYKRISSLLYNDLIKIRILSALVSCLPFLIAAFYLSFSD